MKYLEFLEISGAVSGGCRIPERTAKAIRRNCILNGEPYLEEPHSSKETLYAWESYAGKYRLELGDRDDLPTCREKFSLEGVNVDDPETLDAYLREYLGLEPEDEIDFDLDEYMDPWFLAQDDQWIYELSPEARAYNYLEKLPLETPGLVCERDPLGKLIFNEGDRPGHCVLLVYASNLASLACLQHRLNELGEQVEIEICYEIF